MLPARYPSTRPRPIPILLLAAAVALPAAERTAVAQEQPQAAPETASGAPLPYTDGQVIQIRGRVTNTAGQALPGVQVVLEAYRKAFSLRKLIPGKQGGPERVRRAATTGRDGTYVIDWIWYDYYNRFELAVGTIALQGAEETFDELERVDVSLKITQGSPVSADIRVHEAPAALAAAEVQVTSEAERRVYDELGPPDRAEMFDHPEYEEVTWWYFRHGRAYRFHDGELAQVVPFEPVTPF